MPVEDAVVAVVSGAGAVVVVEHVAAGHTVAAAVELSVAAVAGRTGGDENVLALVAVVAVAG